MADTTNEPIVDTKKWVLKFVFSGVASVTSPEPTLYIAELITADGTTKVEFSGPNAKDIAEDFMKSRS